MYVVSVARAAHTAHLCLPTEDGLLVLPDPGEDVLLDGESLHAADLAAMLDYLHGQGYAEVEDEYGLPALVDALPDGRLVVQLAHVEARPEIDAEEFVLGQRALYAAAGLS